MKKLVLPLSAPILMLWAVLQTPEVLSFSAPFMIMRKALTPLLGGWALGWMVLRAGTVGQSVARDTTAKIRAGTATVSP